MPPPQLVLGAGLDDMRRDELVGKLRQGVWLVLQCGENDVGEVVWYRVDGSTCLHSSALPRILQQEELPADCHANDHGTLDACRHHSWYCGECEQLITASTKKGDGSLGQ